MSSSLLSSQNLVLATAMLVSTTVFFLSFSKHHKISPPSYLSRNQNSHNHNDRSVLRSCLCSKKREGKKKTVKFAEEVKANKKSAGKDVVKGISGCRNEIPGIVNVEGMPANRVALYTGILRDRSHKMECSY